MTTPGTNFLTPEGLQKFAAGDQALSLQAAVDMIRHFCGWHISPSVTVTLQLPVGRSGVIALPSRFVTEIASVGIGSSSSALRPTDYRWQASSSIITLDPPFGSRIAWDRENRSATVMFTHGYDTIPGDVEAIGYEIVQQARSRPGGNSRDVGAGPYRVTLLKLGIGLDDDQRRRLISAGVVRPGIA